MVRKGELACRNGWNEDLWAEAEPGDLAPAAAAPDRFPVRQVPPASPEEIAAVMLMRAPDPDDAAPRPAEDVVVGQATVMPDVNDDDRARVLAQNTREAIRQARERHLAKANVRPPDAPAPPEPDVIGAPVEGAAPPSRRPDAVDPLPPFRSQPARPLARDLADDAEPPHALPADRWPARDFGADPARAQTARRGSAAADLDGDEAQPLSRVISRARRREDEVPSGLDERRPRAAEADRRPAPAPMERPIERRPRPDVPLPEYGNAWQARTWRERARSERAERTDLPSPLEVPPPSEAEQSPVPIVAEAPAPAQFAAPVAEIAGHAALAVDVDDFEAHAERLDMTIRVAPNVPRMCRTCRDFRPADSGDRGWCTSKWAFSHRRMVNADDLTCDASLGCWWLPHDDVWLSTIDISAHGQPTPLLDSRLQLPDAAGGGPGRR